MIQNNLDSPKRSDRYLMPLSSVWGLRNVPNHGSEEQEMRCMIRNAENATNQRGKRTCRPSTAPRTYTYACVYAVVVHAYTFRFRALGAVSTPRISMLKNTGSEEKNPEMETVLELKTFLYSALERSRPIHRGSHSDVSAEYAQSGEVPKNIEFPVYRVVRAR